MHAMYIDYLTTNIFVLATNCLTNLEVTFSQEKSGKDIYRITKI